MQQTSSEIHTQAIEQASWVRHELELGRGLSSALNTGDRAQFGYLLSLLSSDVNEHGFVPLQRAEPAAAPWQPPFAVAPSTPLAATDADWQREDTAVAARSMTAWRLMNALRPGAIHPLNDAKHIPHEVFSNCPHFVQDRLRSIPSANLQGQESDLLDVVDKLKGVERAVA